MGISSKATRTSEHVIQSQVFRWAELQSGVHPELRLLFAIPNSGKRSYALAAYMRAEGLRAGFPDMGLPVARCGFSALYIEQKAKDGKVSDNQRAWHEKLRKENNLVEVCYGFEATIDILTRYVTGQITAPRISITNRIHSTTPA